jgi:hypothetical protein
MASSTYPSLYQLNTRAHLTERGRAVGRPATFDDLTDAELDRLVERGFDWLYLLGIWQTGSLSRQAALKTEWGRTDYQKLLPDLSDTDICGSPFAVSAYTAHGSFGGDEALARLRERLRRRGVRLMLDFVPNHVALDHPWVTSHPEYLIHGSETDLAREPFFPGWADTLQLNYRHPGLRAAMRGELRKVSERGDGARCDMAMLLLPEVIARTWGERSRPVDGAAPVDTPFWPEAIASIKADWPEFVFMAEVYWDLERALQQQGFEYTYDKRLYDRLRVGDALGVLEQLQADERFQRRSVHFLENHDEPRAAATFPFAQHKAAAVITYLVPGMRFFHEGQLEGRRVRVPMQVSRRPEEPVDSSLLEFYTRLLRCVKMPELREGRWQLLPCRPAWDGNSSASQFVAFAWIGDTGRHLAACVNYGPRQGQCYVDLEMPELRGRQWRLEDLLGSMRYDRAGDDLAGRGLYLDLPAWGRHLFELRLQTASYN